MGRSWQETGRFMKAHGIPPAQFSAMMALHYHESMRISDIAERHDVSPAYASQIVDKLVQLGYIQRSEDPHDRRVNRIELTASGRQLVEDAIAARSGWIAPMADRLSPEDAARMADAIEQLTQSIYAADPEMGELHAKRWTNEERC